MSLPGRVPNSMPREAAIRERLQSGEGGGSSGRVASVGLKAGLRAKLPFECQLSGEDESRPCSNMGWHF